MKKYSKSIFTLLVGIMFFINVIMFPAYADTSLKTKEKNYTEYNIKNEILYFDNDGNMGYNVVHQCNMSDKTIINDETGNNIKSLDDVKNKSKDNAIIASLKLDADGQVQEINITAVIKRPVVGISWKSDKIGSDYEAFAEAYKRNGAKAIFLPQFKTEEDAKEYLEDNSVDGIFETGGSDVNPYFYKELQTPYGSAAPNNDRDISDIALIRVAISNNIPLLGVCRGEQIFNVAMGGGLIQDIPYYFGQKVKSGEIDVSRVTKVLCGTLPGHDESENVEDTGYIKRDFSELPDKVDESGEKTFEKGALRVCIDGCIHSGAPSYHPLDNSDHTSIDSNSKWLYKIAGDTSIDLVATAHHQAVNPDKLGKGLTIVAHSRDGIVEAIEYQDNLFALGVQFHPERDALGDSKQAIDSKLDPNQDLSNKFLKTLVMYAAVYDGSLEKEDVEGTKEPEKDPEIDDKEDDEQEDVEGSDEADKDNSDTEDIEEPSLSDEDSNKTSEDLPETGDDKYIFKIILVCVLVLGIALDISVLYKRYRNENRAVRK